MTIEKSKITQNDINIGSKSSATCCPVAIGLFRKYERVSVTPQGINLRRRSNPGLHNLIIFENAWNLQKWILKFDAGESVEPIDVQLDFKDGVASIVEENTR